MVAQLRTAANVSLERQLKITAIRLHSESILAAKSKRLAGSCVLQVADGPITASLSWADGGRGVGGGSGLLYCVSGTFQRLSL